jgi:hypothetical protein
MIETTNANIWLDNSALFDMSKRQGKTPSYDSMNDIITSVMTEVTRPFRMGSNSRLGNFKSM